MSGILSALSPDATLVDERGAVGLGALLAEVERRAAGLARRFAPGQRLAVVATPSRGFFVALLAVMRARTTAVVLSPLHPPHEADAACARARVVAAIVHEDAAAFAAGLSVEAVALESLFALGDPPAPALEDDALVLFTSGTTAAPKGARLTHGNLLAHARVVHEAWALSGDDHLVHALPLHHLHGLGTAALTALAAGATVELLPKFEPARVLRAIASSARLPVWMAVPTTLARLTAAARTEEHRAARTALGRLRLVTNGSAGLPKPVGDRFEALSGLRPLERFGMTECGVATTQPIVGRRVPGSSGFPVTGMDVRVRDDQIFVRGPGVFAGYDGLPSALEDGWFPTGDAGELGPDGLVVRGRISVDVLKSGGYKLSALEIEAAIREHAAVEDVAVVGLPDEEWGDRVVAAIVPQGDLDVGELRAFLRDRLAPYKIPKQLLLRATLPRNGIGKVVKPALVAELVASASR